MGFAEKFAKFHNTHDTLVIAEDRLATELISVGAFYIMGQALEKVLDSKPLEPFINVASKAVLPFIEKSNALMDGLPALESDLETTHRHSLSREESAKHFTKMGLNFGICWGTGLALQTVLQSKLDHHRLKDHDIPLSIPKLHSDSHVKNFVHDNFINNYGLAATMDKATTALCAITLNTKLAKENEAVQDGLQGWLEKIMTKFGVDELKATERANDMAKTVINMGVPNLVGMGVAITGLSWARHQQKMDTPSMAGAAL